MSQEIPFDVELMLSPLALENVCGEDLRYDVIYDRIPECARSEPEGLPMGVWEREIKKSDWTAVATLCYEVLTTRSKDLQVAAWFGEAMGYLYGIGGTTLGWKIFTGLATTFWNDVHPCIVENDIELRLRPVYSFVRKTDEWITTALSPPSRAHELHSSSTISSQQERSALRGLLEEIAALQECLNQHLGDQSPTLHSLRDPILNRLAVLGPELDETSDPDHDPQKLVGGVANGRREGIDNREAAYANIREVAQYLGKTEPHSPVPMILEAVADWRDCQFSDLLVRMPKDSASLYELMKFFRQN